jgi:hypothetical protein
MICSTTTSHNCSVDNPTKPVDPVEHGDNQPIPVEPQSGGPPSTAEVPTVAPNVSPGYGGVPAPGFVPPPGQGPPPGYVWAVWPGGPPPPAHSRGGLSRILHNATVAWIVAGVLALTVVGLSVALASSNSNAAVSPAPFGRFGPAAGRPFGGSGNFGNNGGGSGFFGGNGSGSGVVGTVATVGPNSFTVTGIGGQTVTVDEQSSTTYYTGGATASARSVVVGARVGVQGSRSGNTVTATRVVVLPAGGFGSRSQT